MRTLFDFLYRAYLRMANMIRLAYVKKRFDTFTPPFLFWEKYTLMQNTLRWVGMSHSILASICGATILR